MSAPATAKKRAHLALADGTVFVGEARGAEGVAVGEVVFTTGMTGYQEVLTDPSYTGQLVTMTSPHIGNTGINADDDEGSCTRRDPRDYRPSAGGLIVRELSARAAGPRAIETLDAYLTRTGVVAITSVDTRALTRHLRDHGAQNGAIGTLPVDELIDRARAAPAMEGLDLVAQVTPREAFEVPFEDSPLLPRTASPLAGTGAHIVAIDYGMKRNIARCLGRLGARVTIVPSFESAEAILARGPSGVFLSNGPGDPAALEGPVATVRALLGRTPIFGICLGHQLLARAIGASTYKLKFGHRGLNQPVLEEATGRVLITSQNHGFAVDVATLPKDARATHRHLNDGTSEGLAIPDAKASSVQFHPEAAAGPHDGLSLFAGLFGCLFA
jgi:carbamoyl-phosphate synthase small subunit